MSIFKSQNRIALTARLLLECDKQFLFLAQTPLNGGGLTLPGGKIEHEEFAKEALVREVWEETGVQIAKKSLKLVHITHRVTDNASEIILFFYTASDCQVETEMKEPQKFEKAVLVPSDEVPKELPNVLKHALESINKGRFFSQFPKKKKEKNDPLVKSKVVDLSALQLEHNKIKSGLGKLQKKTREKMMII
ncbi:MAG: NUDIX domain-containing protein [Saprospiraceae bacterium]|nr:NUDIX domain-containing protein [Saprospiraceae bacterium]